MLAAVSKAPVLAKEHLAPIMPAENFAAQEAWSALHPLFGGFRLAATETKQLCSQNRNQSRKLGKFTDELGLVPDNVSSYGTLRLSAQGRLRSRALIQGRAKTESFSRL